MGAVFYRCLSGAPPFVGSTPAEVIAKIATASAPALDVEGTRRTLGAAIDRALVRRPERRYGSMRAFSGAVLAGARAAGIDVALPASLDRALEGAAEETTEGEGWPRAAAVLDRFSIRRAASIALALLVPACSAMLLWRDAPRVEMRPVDRLRSTAAARVAARTSAAVQDVPAPAPTTAIETSQRADETVTDRPPSRTVRSRAKSSARRRAPVADAPRVAADAGLELLVEW
jgi:hypothetical protein